MPRSAIACSENALAVVEDVLSAMLVAAGAPRSAACTGGPAAVKNGVSVPTRTLIRPSVSMRMVMLASTRWMLLARGLANSRLVPDMPTSALGATATGVPAGVAQNDVAQPQRRVALLVALELGAADRDPIAAAEILLDGGGEPRRREIEQDRPA